MIDMQANITRLKETIAAWHATKGASTDTWLTLFSDDIDFRSLANGAASLGFTTPRSNKAGVADYLAALGRQFEMIDYVSDEFVVDGERVAVIGHCSFKSRASGHVFDTPKIDICRFRDGKVCAFHEYYDTLAVMQPQAKPTAPRIVLKHEQLMTPQVVGASERAANIATLRKGYATWRDSKGLDVDGWLSIMDRNVRFESVAAGAPALAFSRHRLGIDEARGYLTEVTREWSMNDFAFDDFISDRDYVVAIGRCAWTSKRNGIRVDTQKLDVWRMRGGKVVQFYELFDTHRAFAAANAP